MSDDGAVSSGPENNVIDIAALLRPSLEPAEAEDAPPSPSASADPDETAPLWEKMPHETAKQFRAFAMYRDMGADRSVMKVARKLSVTKPVLQKWSSENRWVHRANAYDLHLDQITRQAGERARAEGLEAFRQRTMHIAQAQQALAVRVMHKLNRLLNTMEARPASVDEEGNAVEATPEVFPEVDAIPRFMRAAAFMLNSSVNAEAQALSVEELLTAVAGQE